jgi:hypothetical protein
MHARRPRCSALLRRVKSSVVRSARAAIVVCVRPRRRARSPPALTNGATDGGALAPYQRCGVGSLTNKSVATVSYGPLPDLCAHRTLARSVGYGLGMRAAHHRLTINSSELWG